MRVFGQRPGGGLARLLSRPCLFVGASRQFPEGPQTPLPDGPLGVLRDHAKHSANAPLVVGDWAVRESVIGFLGKSLPFQEEEQSFVPGRLPVADDRLGTGADVAPNLRPDLAGRPAQRPRVLRGERHSGIGVVVEEGEIRPPAKPHGVAAVKHNADGDLEALRPLDHWPQRGFRPVEPTSALSHLAAAGEKCGSFHMAVAFHSFPLSTSEKGPSPLGCAGCSRRLYENGLPKDYAD